MGMGMHVCVCVFSYICKVSSILINGESFNLYTEKFTLN
jgi:hypothetical protein